MVTPSNRREDITQHIFHLATLKEAVVITGISESELPYVRNGHLTAALEKFLLPVVSAVLHTWYKQQLQHAHTVPNADTPWQGFQTPDLVPHPKLKPYPGTYLTCSL